MKGYLWAHDLGLKDFGEHAEQISRRVKEASLTSPVLPADRLAGGPSGVWEVIERVEGQFNAEPRPQQELLWR